MVNGRSFLANCDANDFSLRLTAVPEPEQYATMAAFGIAGFAVLRRVLKRRRR